MTKVKRKDFSGFVVEAVDEALSTLGESPKHAILFWLKNKYDTNLSDAITAPHQFMAALEAMFGSGANYIERQILGKLHSKLKLKYQEKAGHSFESLIKEIKEAKKFSTTATNRTRKKTRR